ncbi:unnamed protein product [Sphenostylis stenocarpa]|uniref:Uncharacterized protein n=1 Tax=Sphenostylis stenocarpa TaxID=92480 RepID=A0AA86S557_9FABA|nr:unnamed protein product [Sphenostylis stenocarpa]
MGGGGVSLRSLDDRGCKLDRRSPIKNETGRQRTLNLPPVSTEVLDDNLLPGAASFLSHLLYVPTKKFIQMGE